ncbi:unnamed protein product [Symbiodinium natans]|uniref:Uncharacterized protein n=1 Tax=Symbiodinium natans TaxID=878477 RepID=A0A812VCC8_9DINO|nr:unnamed protein product [Symbiodinium natans]
MAAIDSADRVHRVRDILDSVWPTARRPLAPFVVTGLDILDGLHDCLAAAIPNSSHGDGLDEWPLELPHSETGVIPVDLDPQKMSRCEAYKMNRQGRHGPLDLATFQDHWLDFPMIVLTGAFLNTVDPVIWPTGVALSKAYTGGALMLHSMAAGGMVAFSYSIAKRLPDKQPRTPMRLAAAAMACGALREVIALNLDTFGFVGDLALKLVDLTPAAGAAVVAVHYLSDAVSMPLVVAFLGTFSKASETGEIAQIAIHGVMPAAMFNLFAAGAVIAVTPVYKGGLIAGSLGCMMYTFWGMAVIEEKVWSIDRVQFEQVRMSSDLLRMTMCLIGLVQVGGVTHCLPPEWQHNLLTILELLLAGVCHLSLKDPADNRIRTRVRN